MWYTNGRFHRARKKSESSICRGRPLIGSVKIRKVASEQLMGGKIGDQAFF